MTLKTHKDLKPGDLLYFKPTGKSNRELPFLFFIVIGFQFDNSQKEIIMFNVSKSNSFIYHTNTIDFWLIGSAEYYGIPEIIRS